MPTRATVTPSPLVLGATSLLLGVAVWYLPPAMVAYVRSLTLDALRPGVMATQHLQETLIAQRERWRSAELQRWQAERDAARAEAEQATARLQRLTAQFVLQQDRAFSTSLQAPSASTEFENRSPALFLPALVSARIIGDTLSREWRAGRLIDGGWRDGIREQALVLKSRRPLIDLGDPDQLSPDDPLLIGHHVVGKVEVVGRWTSTFLPVTDPDFRAAVQVVRQTDDGPVWGAKGILRGSDDGCAIDGILADAAVRVGDSVFSAGRDGTLEAPLFYGTVSEASLDADDREWQIRVTPASAPSTITQVRVLRAALNPQRLWAH